MEVQDGRLDELIHPPSVAMKDREWMMPNVFEKGRLIHISFHPWHWWTGLLGHFEHRYLPFSAYFMNGSDIGKEPPVVGGIVAWQLPYWGTTPRTYEIEWRSAHGSDLDHITFRCRKEYSFGQLLTTTVLDHWNVGTYLLDLGNTYS